MINRLEKEPVSGDIQSSSRSGGIESSLSALHVFHALLRRLCWQMLPPPHSLHVGLYSKHTACIRQRFDLLLGF